MKTKNFATNVHFTVILLITIYLPKFEGAIQCYKCLVAQPTYYTNETVRLCKDFDYSEKFIVNCPYSTFCKKQITSARIPIPINGTERDCANQKFETQNYKNGSWQPELHVEEPYQEGCAVVNDKGLRTTSIKNCYCKGDLCNDANSFIMNSAHLKLLSVIYLFIIILL